MTEAGILYAINEWEDYAGGGWRSVFSTYEKAKEHYNRMQADTCSSIEIITIKLDDPLYEGEVLDYKHG
jgi:hypothetical protein